MKEIKRYLVSGSEFEVTQHPDGDYVEFEDHAAIVAAKDERIAALQDQVRALAEEPGREAGTAIRIERIREIRAQGVEGFVEFNRKLAKDYPTAMVAKALEITELNGEQYAARIRAGEQP